MKPYQTFIIMMTVITVFSCAGNPTVEESPDTTISDGMEEIKMGSFLYKKGCYDRSLQHFFSAHELFSLTDQLSGIAMSMNNIGNIFRLTGDTERALLYYGESFEIYTQIKDHKGAIQTLSNKAAALVDSDRLQDAEKILDKAQKISHTYNTPYTPLLSNRGVLLIKKKDYPAAEQVLNQALLASDPDNKSEIATINFALGNLMVAKKSYQQAVVYFKSALVADQAAGFHKNIADDLAAIAMVYVDLGESNLAIDFFKRSAKIYALHGNREKVHKLLEQMDTAAKNSGTDITITKQLVNNWLEGDRMEDPCD